MVTDSNPTNSADRAQPIDRGAAERRKRHGLTIVFTGNGKGKTTASIGLVVRAAGNGMRVFFLQFIKGQWKSGEREILRALPGVDLEVTGRGFTIEGLRDPRIPMDDHAAAAALGWQRAKEIVQSGEYDLVVLDEILGAVHADLVPLDALLEDIERLLSQQPDRLLVLDEAYAAFALGGWRSEPLLAKQRNLVILRSLTKEHAAQLTPRRTRVRHMP